jgi:serine-type D-Ala-D-Ala carboxypeptidase (penicillin-binding protein 5/6)
VRLFKRGALREYTVQFILACGLIVTTLQAQTLPPITSPQWLVQHWGGNGASTLASQAADLPTHPASITKLLTAYVTMQAVAAGQQALTTELTVSPAAAAQDGTRVGYLAGERVALQDAVQGMLAISGNDAAWALAEHVGGSVDAFVTRMNRASQALGLSHSQWRNPHGLTQDGHASTAADLAALAHALWRDFPAVRPWLGVKTYTWHGVAQSNRNTLLWRDATVDGLKTGHTDAAGYNLAASSVWRMTVGADAYDWRLASIVLGAASADARAKDSAALLAWARGQFSPWRLYAANDSVGYVKLDGANGRFSLLTAQPIWLLLPNAQSISDLRYELLPLPSVSAPVGAGAEIATLNIYQGDSLLSTSPAVTAQAIARAAWYERLWAWVKSML